MFTCRTVTNINHYRIILGIIYPIVILMLCIGASVASYSDLPGRISIHFNTSRVPTTSLPTPVFGIVILSVLVLSTFACVSVAFSKRPFIFDNHKTLAGCGGFFSAVALSFTVGAIAIHRGLDNWHDATGPGWLIAIPIISGFLGAFFTEYLATTIHGHKLSV